MRRAVQSQAHSGNMLSDLPERTREAVAEGQVRGVVRTEPPERDRSGREAEAPWQISDHAITRYIQRVMRGRTVERARADLVWMLERAHFVKTLPSGMDLWRGPKPLRLRLRVDGERNLVTVLTDCDRRRQR